MSQSPSPSSTTQRRQHTKEFKQESLGLAARVGVTRAATDLGINKSTLYAWKKCAETEGRDAFRGHGQRTEVEAEMARMRREIEVLKMEREILKKAAEFWVKERG
jgi:transposase